MSDLNAGINEITNPMAFVSAEGVIYVKITSEFGCTAVAQITLKFYPVVQVKDVVLKSCFIESNPSTALFNLTNAAVAVQQSPVPVKNIILHWQMRWGRPMKF